MRRRGEVLALPYGGVHRLVDFALSGLVHADLAGLGGRGSRGCGARLEPGSSL